MPGFLQGFPHHRRPIRPVIRQGLPGPVAGNEDAAAAETEILPIMGLPWASARPQTRGGVLGLDAVAEPVRTRLRHTAATAIPREAGQCAPHTAGSDGLSSGVWVSAMDFGQILRQIADGAVRIFGGGDNPGEIGLGAESGHMHRPGVGVGLGLVQTPRPRWVTPRPVVGST